MAIETRKTGAAGRAIIWLAVAILVGIIAYAGAWFYVAARIHAASLDIMEDSAANGVHLACENSRIQGFPFRFGLHCDAVLAESEQNAVRLDAGALRTAAQFYNPAFLVGELDGEARIAAPGLGNLTLDWEGLRASLRYAKPYPERISIEARQIEGAHEAGSAPLFRADRAELHIRSAGSNLDAAANLAAMHVDPGITGGVALPPVDAAADLTLEDGVAWLYGLEGSLRGRAGTIRSLRIATASAASVTAHGTFAVDAEGLANADLTVKVENPRQVGEFLAGAVPSAAEQIRQISGNLDFFGPAPELPVTIRGSVVSVGPFKVGTIRPLP